MLTPSLQKMRSQIEDLFLKEKDIKKSAGNYAELLDVLDQMDLFEAELSRAYDQGGLAATIRVIIKPAEPNCGICGRTILPKQS